MAAADEILGISGQMDISDIQQSFDKLINDLNSLGVKTDEVSSKMTKALNDIAQSSVSDSEKTKQSVQTLKQGIEDINKSLSDTPEALKKLASEAQTAEATVDKLKKRLSETTEGSPKWNEINEQLKSQQGLVEKLNGEYSSMLGTFGSTQQYVGTLNAAIDTLNAGRSISTATTGANAAAHVGAAAAVGTEAVAHGENSTKIAEETEKTQQNTQAKLHLTESAKDYVYTTQMEAEAIDAVAKRLAEGRSDEEEYINSKKSGLAVRETLVQKIEEEKQKIKELSDAYANSQDANNGVATPETQKAYNEGVKEATDNIKEYRSELSSLNQSLDNLESSHFKAQQAINGQTDATQNLKQATEEAKNASDIYFNGEKATIEGVTEALKLDYQELKQLKAEYATYKGAGDTENAKKNLEEQKELNKHISEGRDVLKQLGTSYEDAAKGAKKTKEETKEVAKSADEAAKKVGGIFSNFKSVLGGALKGDFSGLFSLFGKIGIWGAGLGTLGKGIYELTIRAEEFRNALQPLSHYLDESNLQAVRQNILSLSDETAKSVSDMVAAATQFAKVWDSLRESPEALTTMIKSSNEFGALAGKTSEEGAKFLSNLASEYHMTAQEATEASSMIATAAHNSTSSFGEMADAISSAGSSAALYGVSFKEMATLIGYSSNQFGGAQKAASKFSMLLMSMSKMQDKYNPSVVGMITALQNLKDAYDRGEHVENNFMARQRSIAMYFIKNANAIAKYNKGIDSNAAKQELLNDINAKASTNVAKLQNSWNGFLTAINANLTPTLTRILNFFTKIIGGAQRTADELNYLKNFDNNHKGAKRGMQYTKSVTSGWTAGFQESTVANMGARQQYNYSKEDGLKLYQQQRDRLKRIYQQGLKNAQNTWKHASSNAYAKSAGNFMVQYYNKNRSSFSEFTPQMFNDLLRNQRNSTISLLQKPINSNTNLGGNSYVPKSKKDKTADQQRNYREQLAEQQAKQLAYDKKIEWELYIAEQEEGIAKEHDASEKELKQRKLDFEKKKHQIEEEAETLRQKNIQIAKAEYSKNPANKKKEGFYASGLDKGVKLTDEQQKLIDAKMNLLNSQQKAKEEKNLKSVTDKYKDENQKRFDLEKQYNDDIAKIQKSRAEKEKELNAATTEEQKVELQKQIENLILAEAQAKKQKGEAIIGFDFELLKKNPDYIAAFEDLNNVSTETLNNLIELFDKAKEKAAESMSPDQLREYTNTLQQMQDELLGRENPFKQVATAKVEYQVSDDQVKALEKYIKALNTGKNIAEATDIVEKKLGTTYKTREEAEKALAKAKDKRNKAENKYLKAVKTLNQKINELANAISGLGNTIGGTEGKILGLIGDVLTFVTQTSDGIKAVAATGVQAISTIEKASVILTIISAAIQLMQKISSLYKDSHAQYEEYAAEIKQVNDLTNAVNEYKLAVLSATQAKEKWFATSGLKDLTDAANYNKEALKGYLEAATQAQAVYQNEKGGGWFTNTLKWLGSTVGKIVSLPSKLISKGLEAIGINMDTWIGDIAKWGIDGVFGGVEGIIGKSIGSIIDNSDNYKKGTTAAVNNLRIETRKKTHGFLGSGIGAKSQKTENLVDWAKNNGYGDLFDENMFINVEAAKSIIEKQGDKLVGETKETLETLIKFKEEYDKFNEELESYVSDAYSPLADDLTNALFNWLDSGEDVMDKFKEYASDTFKDIAKEIVKTAVLGQVFNAFQDKVKELYKMYSISDGSMTEKQLSQGIANTTKELMTSVNKSLPMLQDLMKSMDEQFKQLGIDIAGASQSQQTATGKAIEAITADQASSLIGIGYAVQIAQEKGNEVRKAIAVDISFLRIYAEQTYNNISEMRDIQYQGLEQLEAINKNTAPIILIREDIASMYKLMKDRY